MLLQKAHKLPFSEDFLKIKLLPNINCYWKVATFLISFLPGCQCFPRCSPLSGCDWQVGYIHAISPSARSYSLLEPSSTGQINLPCQREGALRGPISRWLGRGWEGWGVTAMGPSQAWLVSISSQPQGQLGAEPQWALINGSHSEAWTVTTLTHTQVDWCWCIHSDNTDITLCTHSHEDTKHTHKHTQRDMGSKKWTVKTTTDKQKIP